MKMRLSELKRMIRSVVREAYEDYDDFESNRFNRVAPIDVRNGDLIVWNKRQRRVVGTPFDNGDGTVSIPVSKLSGGGEDLVVSAEIQITVVVESDVELGQHKRARSMEQDQRRRR